VTFKVDILRKLRYGGGLGGPELLFKVAISHTFGENAPLNSRLPFGTFACLLR
jgi:hypothetical protein